MKVKTHSEFAAKKAIKSEFIANNTDRNIIFRVNLLKPIFR